MLKFFADVTSVHVTQAVLKWAPLFVIRKPENVIVSPMLRESDVIAASRHIGTSIPAKVANHARAIHMAPSMAAKSAMYRTDNVIA